jgi:hypothetical protein
MKTHLDQTLDKATHRLTGNFTADIRDYERVHRHILEMAECSATGSWPSSRTGSASRPRTDQRAPGC